MLTKSRQWVVTEALLNRKLITESQLNEALAEQRETKQPLERILVDLNVIDKGELSALKKSLKKTLVDLNVIDKGELSALEKEEPVSISKEKLFPKHIDLEILKLIPETIAKRYHLIPLFKDGKVITVAMADSSDVVTIDTIRTISGYEINAVPASEKDIMAAIDKNYGGFPDMETVLLDLVKVDEATTDLETGMDVTQIKLRANDPPVIKFVNLLLLDAIERRASDIHIEPKEKTMDIRIRIDGVLHKVSPPPKTMCLAIISRIKILSNLDIAEHRLPQDGRCLVKIGDRRVDIRVSTLPTMYGQRVVMRLLDTEKLFVDLKELGFAIDQFSTFQEVLKRPYGMILVTGPTGSGKTTTLYAGLKHISTVEKNIITIEDPIEYDLAGINQVQVKPNIGLTFANGLRSILRQDPDVILIGEIRDRETAEIAIRAALTGHLVFSTLHTNDAVDAIAQLEYFNIEPYLIASAVDLIIAQRLVRRICSHCQEPHAVSDKVLEQLGLAQESKNDFKLFKGKGCSYCNYTGYRGRTAAYQFFEITSRVKKLIFEGANMDILRKEASKQGMRTLRESVIEKFWQGITTIEETLSITFEE